MNNLKIGNWLITADGIEWTGERYNGYFISKDRLLQEPIAEKGTYDWLLHLAQKNWLTETDIYALNTALMYALEYFGMGSKRSKISFVKTIDEQQRLMHIKNECKRKPTDPLLTVSHMQNGEWVEFKKAQ